MKVLRSILSFFWYLLLSPYYLFVFFIRGFKGLSLFLSRGFYFYFDQFFQLLQKIFPSSFSREIKYCKKREEEPGHIIGVIASILVAVWAFDYFYTNPGTIVLKLPTASVEDILSTPEDKAETIPLFANESSLFRTYSDYSLRDINIHALKKANKDTVAWLMVEGTSINYPIVQTDNNDYYLNHSYDHTYTYNGWPFMDYRNDSLMDDRNTVFYGHNLINGTSFGSIKNVFNTDKDYYIMVVTREQKQYIYKIFAYYETEPDVFYIQTEFHNNSEFLEFLSMVEKKSAIPFQEEFKITDKIITLTTCTDDSHGRKVVHAKLVDIKEI